MTRSIEDRVYSLVAEERGICRGKLTRHSTLSHDRGMEGDDAVEFFQKFRNQFAVDLSKLDEDWDEYFAPEGVNPFQGLIVLGPGVLLGFSAIRSLPNVPGWLSFSAGLLLWLIPFFYFTHRRSRSHPQITVQDLITCAQAGRWTKIPSSRSA